MPKRVEPPRLLSVLLISGVALGLLLFAYSTTQIYLRFSEPPVEQGAVPPAGEGEELESPDVSDQETSPEVEGSEDSGNAPQAGGENGSPAGSGTVSYQIVDSADSSFTGQATVTNTSDAPLEDWELALGFADAQVTSARDVNWESTEDGFVARQSPGTAPLAPGESAVVDFTAEGSAQTPNSCSLNGNSCTL